MLNNSQKAYVADCLKIAGTAQLGLLGIRYVYDNGAVGGPYLIVSLLIWVLAVVLGTMMLEGQKED